MYWDLQDTLWHLSRANIHQQYYSSNYVHFSTKSTRTQFVCLHPTLSPKHSTRSQIIGRSYVGLISVGRMWFFLWVSPSTWITRIKIFSTITESQNGGKKMPRQSNFRPFSISGQYCDLLISLNAAKWNLGEVKIKTMLVRVRQTSRPISCWWLECIIFITTEWQDHKDDLSMGHRPHARYTTLTIN